MEEKENLIKKFNEELANCDNLNNLQQLRVKFLGKKGYVTELSKSIGTLSIEDKKTMGKVVNELRTLVESKLLNMQNILEEKALNQALAEDKIDISLPGNIIKRGVSNVLNQIEDDITAFFVSQGYDVAIGPEVELDLYNFEMLNLPKDHPARDAQDSFYFDDNTLLRTHTSPVQAREMLKNIDKTPMRMICPGKTYRRDEDDATHSHQFSQIEGLVIDENISVVDLLGTLELLVKHIFGADKKVRFRTSYFPFTEPSYEVDVSTPDGDWIEVLGSGMVHPNVLRSGGYDPDKYTGFAFGLGIERMAMLKYDIKDIRDLYTNDLRFLNNFNQEEVTNNEA